MTPERVLSLDLDNLDEDDVDYLHFLKNLAQKLILQKSLSGE